MIKGPGAAHLTGGEKMGKLHLRNGLSNSPFPSRHACPFVVHATQARKGFLGGSNTLTSRQRSACE